MSAANSFSDVLEMALKLSPKERVRLIERVASSVEHEIEATPAHEQPADEHWGKSLNRLLDSLDMSAWEALEIDDPVAWVKQQRDDELKRRLGDWGQPE